MILKEDYIKPEVVLLDIVEETAILQASNENVNYEDWTDQI